MNGITIRGKEVGGSGHYLYIGPNHHGYDTPGDAVYISLGEEQSRFLNEYSTFSVEQAEQLRDTLTGIIDEFNANAPKKRKNSEILAELGIGAVIRVNDEVGPWVKHDGGLWASLFGIQNRLSGETDEFFDYNDWDITVISEGVKL